MKRWVDILFSVVGLLLLSPFFIVIAIIIILDSKGGVFYKQERIGLNQKPFYLLKFRSMYIDSDRKGLLTVGINDSRITKIGFFIRKYKIDELSQLINVFIGDMSLVGPRPEVRKYVENYTKHQKKIFKVKPGITDIASILYFDENELLSQSEFPEKYYEDVVLPQKLQLGILYVENNSFFLDFKLILITIVAIFSKKKSLLFVNRILNVIK